jgi:hypothetical protein
MKTTLQLIHNNIIENILRRRSFHCLPLKGVGVEIGVRQGAHAVKLARLKDVTRLFCVDPYLPFFENGWNVPKSFQDVAKKKAMKRVGSKGVFIEKMSIPASQKFLDGSMDFIYLDALHDYDSVIVDIAAWFPKVKAGGYFGGDDFCNRHPGVIKAVCEFVANTGLDLKIQNDTWWIKKEK